MAMVKLLDLYTGCPSNSKTSFKLSFPVILKARKRQITFWKCQDQRYFVIKPTVEFYFYNLVYQYQRRPSTRLATLMFCGTPCITSNTNQIAFMSSTYSIVLQAPLFIKRYEEKTCRDTFSKKSSLILEQNKRGININSLYVEISLAYFVKKQEF